ncbi:zinc finger protein ZAT5-like [Benincasa hispida]|uniref:zinc finger protein ZAT5-like n=1 Tax=Benincasa hispida TaxID=102211 RepID=UPI00190224B4|nr:zinc finger protein ZAT5-like [Benincasa hispida]
MNYDYYMQRDRSSQRFCLCLSSIWRSPPFIVAILGDEFKLLSKYECIDSMSPNYFSELPNCELLGQCHSFINFSSSSSSNGRDGGRSNDDNDDDDEDVANCLILLAQGLPANSQPSSSLGKFFRDPEGQNGASKAADCCAYECKTCHRTFPSFQALGGHRSSHKNAAMAAADNHKPISGTASTYKQQQQRLNNNDSNRFDQLRMSRSDYYNKLKLVNHRIKVHECSVCGAEFISGQALGGHMRRHRRGCGGASRDSSEIERRCPKKQRSNLLRLDLDLNFPAPEDDKRDKSGVVAMAATNLVDCHY